MRPRKGKPKKRCRYPIGLQPYQECGETLSGKGQSKFCKLHGPAAWKTRPLSDPTATSTNRVQAWRKEHPFLYYYKTTVFNKSRKYEPFQEKISLLIRLRAFLRFLPYVYLLKLSGQWEKTKKLLDHKGDILHFALRLPYEVDISEVVSKVRCSGSQMASYFNPLTQQPFLFDRWQMRRDQSSNHGYYIRDIKIGWPISSEEFNYVNTLHQQCNIFERWRHNRLPGLANLGFSLPDVLEILITETCFLALYYAADIGLTAQDLREFDLPANITSFYRHHTPSELLCRIPPNVRWVWVFNNGFKLDFTLPHPIPPGQEIELDFASGILDTSMECRLIGYKESPYPSYPLLHVPGISIKTQRCL